ncbi:MAG TPA: YigZ family protein [Brevefilum fermentans]|jgi:uncharacterized YigZ family protein|uniref:YigZ family protein n=1 Tax=Candidatus Brevifilum fermentans TaxID=1986204 RepID=A0A1Y6K7V9_9CHLR|nr:YigZ family protein [Brevefilum fermentans]MDI9566489.1 YigZ family protein [Chloroflexota bacterium]OQB83702.1 MAG: IMPACT family member YigZ [Chloroflexi bacterium ADurb.Bin120]SMX54679.1 conserved protein of unknown function [Brevefilum fermentans]HOM67734.1 YigZ family protein [Brevefilum fermentans]HPX96242.1 YigZ family protein [Brevefilum fermentans]
MSEYHLIPARRVETELIDRNSRFITNAAPAFSVEEAQAFIDCVRKKHPDANHHVPVYLIGHGNAVIAHCSDAGEPAGTAGRPALAVLQGSGLGDIVAVITRYFGGTKLGTGGLVRAYSDSIRIMLEELPLAKKVATTTIMFVVPYSFFEQTKLMVYNHDGMIMDQNFGADVTLTVRLINKHLASFKDRMDNLTHGGIEFITIEERENTIMPLRNKQR